MVRFEQGGLSLSGLHNTYRHFFFLSLPPLMATHRLERVDPSRLTNSRSMNDLPESPTRSPVMIRALHLTKRCH